MFVFQFLQPTTPRQFMSLTEHGLNRTWPPLRRASSPSPPRHYSGPFNYVEESELERKLSRPTRYRRISQDRMNLLRRRLDFGGKSLVNNPRQWDPYYYRRRSLLNRTCCNLMWNYRWIHDFNTLVRCSFWVFFCIPKCFRFCFHIGKLFQAETELMQLFTISQNLRLFLGYN